MYHSASEGVNEPETKETTPAEAGVRTEGVEVRREGLVGVFAASLGRLGCWLGVSGLSGCSGAEVIRTYQS